MLNLPLNALRAFAYVYEANGVRPAARKMGVSHSAISRHVHELEAWLGTQLLEAREGQRRLAFTAAGKHLGAAALDHLQALDATLNSIREARQANSVVISTTASIAVRWLLPRLPELETSLSDVEISVLTEQQVIDPDGIQVDIALRMGHGPWQNTHSQALMDDGLFPAVHPRLLTGTGRHPLELFSSHPLIHDRDPAASWRQWFSTYPVKGIDVRRGPRFSSSDLVIRSALQGLGIGLVRARLARDEINSGALARPFGHQEISLPDAYWIVTPDDPDDGACRPVVTRVVEWLRRKAIEPER